MKVKKRILFVDDDATILQGLRRILRPMQDEWETEFSSSGQLALQILGKAHFDIVVSDMRMPIMDGAQLLNEVKNKFPDTIRIILSGQATETAILRAAGSMHQYLSKPCNFENLKTVITRACTLRDYLNNPALNKLISKIESIPSFPKLYAEVMDELRSPDGSIKKVGKIISKDIGMSTKILQMANSAFFGFSQTIASADHAVQILGLDTIKALVLSHQIFSQFDPAKIKHFSIDNLLNHSMNIGGLALKIAQAEKMGPDIESHAFTAGLIHDIGMLIVAQNLPDQYQEALSLAKENQIDLWRAEEEIFHASHEAIGAYLLGLWGLPDPIVETVAFHHCPGKQVDLGFCHLTIVHIAHVLEYEMGIKPFEYPSFAMDESYLEQLGLLDRIPVWRNICQKNINEFI